MKLLVCSLTENLVADLDANITDSRQRGELLSAGPISHIISAVASRHTLLVITDREADSLAEVKTILTTYICSNSNALILITAKTSLHSSTLTNKTRYTV